MIKEFVKAWDKRKSDLEKYFKTHKNSEYHGYISLVKLLFQVVINPEVKSEYDLELIHEIDDGDYQGTVLFIIPQNTYQPCASQYVFTSAYYGSCSVCDTLQGIQDRRWDELPDAEQVDEYMALCLHLLQSCHYLIDNDKEKD